MPAQDPRPALRAPDEGKPISRNEIMDVMADEGYSADSRKAWLKEVLTRATRAHDESPDPDKASLIAEMKTILRRQIPGDPEAEDTL